MDRLKIDGNGRLPVPNLVARELAGAELELTSYSDRHLLLSVRDDEQPVVFTGSMGEINIADLLSFFNMFRKSGVLRFELEGGRKALFFQDGEVVYATSSFPDEDLGEILYELGKVDRDNLDRARQFANGRTTLGKVLVEKNVVSAKDLWHAGRLQVESIVYNLFNFDEGSFFFQARTLDKERIVRLSMSTQNLIMEGLRRVDERALFMRKIPSFDFIPVPTEGVPEGLSGGEKKIMEMVLDVQGNVRDLIRASGMGEFDGLRALYQLAEKGFVRFEEAPVVELGGRLGQIATVCNSALASLSKKVREQNPQFLDSVRRFLKELPQPYSFVLRDVELSKDGTLDVGRILANLEGLAEGDKEKLLADTFNEIIYMECMAARRDLGATESAELVQRVQEVAQRVMNLVGRKEC
ncbi:MAG: DUF4388 domain-containing protein [Desulfuromonadales bacterium]|nr:DUF4388 domain-containing protein [Desulfuromonadales bacterium]NIS40657.1 DUF4388 domain-containing protein [Desulfuromonadales bacterium]